MSAADSDALAGRSGTPLRIPFVRRCQLAYPTGRESEAFLVNLSVVGAYVACDDRPDVGQPLVCRFQIPGSEREVAIGCEVAWINTRQQHPVHSLPLGFGLHFVDLASEARRRIERLVRERLALRSGGR